MTRFSAYEQWTERRIQWILDHYGDAVFRGRSVLDVGGGRGHVAERILDLGAASVEVVEGRLGNIREGVARPGLTFTHANLERGLQAAGDAYDIVVNFGIIYHLVNWERLLIESVVKARELLFLESEVIDSETEATRYVIEWEGAYDWAMSGIGSRPSEFEVDRILARIPGSKSTKALDSALNARLAPELPLMHRYDWEPKLEGLTEHGLRRFWAVERAATAGDATEQRELDRLYAEVHEAKLIDTLMIARRTQQLIERRPGLPGAPDGPPLVGDPAPAPAPPPPAPVGPRPALSSRDLLVVLARMRPLQDALGVVEDELSRDDLDRSRRLPDHAFPHSCTDEEGLAMYHVIASNGLRSGFEVATAFGYSAAFIGLGLQRNRGQLITMDCYVEEWKESHGYERDELIAAVHETLARVEGGDPPRGLAFAEEQLSALGLDDVVTLSIGVSPESVQDALSVRGLDFAHIDGGRSGDQPRQDLEAILPRLDGERCAVFFRGTADGGSVADAVAAAESALDAPALRLPTRSGLTLVGRGLDPGSIAALDELFVRTTT